MKAPDYPSDISKEWLEFVLNDYEKKLQSSSTVVVNTFTLGEGMNLGDGFAGQIVKLDVEATLSSDCYSESKEYNLIIKLMDASAMDREMNRRYSADVREMIMYKEVIPELNKFAKTHGGDEYCLSMPGIIYGKCIDDEFVLVMENLKHQGFDTLTREKGLSYSQIMMAVEYLAKLHALSYSYDKRYGFLDKFPCYKKDYMTNMYVGFGKYLGLMNAKTVLNAIDGQDEIVKRIELAEPRIMKDYDEAMEKVTPTSIMCLTHADLWNNNLMFKVGKTNNNQEVTEAMHVLDWQRSFWNTSVYDLHFLIYTSTTRQIRKGHLEQVLQHYHALFTTITKQMGISIEWSYEDFKSEYNRLQVYGVLRGLLITQFALSEEIKEYKKKEAINCVPYSFMKPVYYYLAKLLTPVKLSSPGQYLFNKFARYMIATFGKEMIEGNNLHMRERVLDILYEADSEGFFDNK